MITAKLTKRIATLEERSGVTGPDFSLMSDWEFHQYYYEVMGDAETRRYYESLSDEQLEQMIKENK